MITVYGHRTVIAGRDQWVFAEYRQSLDTHKGTITTLEQLPRERGEPTYLELVEENKQLKERIAKWEEK